MSTTALDPHELAKKQLARDRIRTARVRAWMHGEPLAKHKIDRMSPSPLAFLRGAAPLFYDVMERVPILASGPAGEGYIVGDLHLENFGAFRPDPGKKRGPKNTEAAAVFDANDFDDCAIGPWRFDLVRLTTSLMLGGRELGADGRETLGLASALLDSYAREIAYPGPLPPFPRTVRTLLDRATHRDRESLLDGRTQPYKKSRRFVRGPRYAEISRSLARDAELAFHRYLDAHVPKRHHDAYEVQDMAFRIAGTGSLGCLRIAVLVRRKGQKRAKHWVFDMKEEDKDPSAIRLLKRKGQLYGAERVETGERACLSAIPRGLGRTMLRNMPMLVRRLTPQEDKLDLTNIPKPELEGIARLLGALIGRAHVKGATRRAQWNAKDQRHIVDCAVRLAGIHEATYLAFCRLVTDHRE